MQEHFNQSKNTDSHPITALPINKSHYTKNPSVKITDQLIHTNNKTNKTALEEVAITILLRDFDHYSKSNTI